MARGLLTPLSHEPTTEPPTHEPTTEPPIPEPTFGFGDQGSAGGDDQGSAATPPTMTTPIATPTDSSHTHIGRRLLAQTISASVLQTTDPTRCSTPNSPTNTPTGALKSLIGCMAGSSSQMAYWKRNSGNHDSQSCLTECATNTGTLYMDGVKVISVSHAFVLDMTASGIGSLSPNVGPAGKSFLSHDARELLAARELVTR